MKISHSAVAGPGTGVKPSITVPPVQAVPEPFVTISVSTPFTSPTRISKIGNATLRSSIYMPALSAIRFNPAVDTEHGIYRERVSPLTVRPGEGRLTVAALVARLKSAGCLQPKQIVVAAMRKLLVLCFGVLKTRADGRRSARSPATGLPAPTAPLPDRTGKVSLGA